MAISIGDIFVKMTMNSAEWETGTKKATRAFNDMNENIERGCKRVEKSIDSFKRSVEAFAVAEKLQEGFAKIVEETTSAEESFKQIEARIRSTGGAAGVTAKQVADMSDALSELNGIDDDVINSMEGVLLSFTAIGKNELPRVTQAVIDLSVGMKIDLQSAAVQLGKAMNDPIKGVQSLQKEGVKLSAAATDLVAGFVKTGQSAKAQAVILKELETEFGGAAAAARNTLGGALKALNTAFDDLFKSAKDTDAMRAFREGIETGIVVLRRFQQSLGVANDDQLQYWQNVRGMGAGITVVFADIALAAKHATNTVIETYKQLANNDWIKNSAILNGVGSLFQSGLKGVHDQIKADAKDGSKDYVGEFLQPLIDGWKKAGEAARQNMRDMDEISKKYKPKGADFSGPKGSEIDEATKAAKKLSDEWDKQVGTVTETLKAYKQKTDALKNELKDQKEITDYEQARQKIMEQTALTEDQRRIALDSLLGLERERLEVNQDLAIKDDAKRLDAILANQKERLKEAQNELAGKKELNVVEQAQKEIEDAIKAGKEYTAEKQKEILDTAKDLLKVQEQIKQKESVENIKKITEEMKQQAVESRLKLLGQEDLIPLIKAEKQLREEAAKAGLTDDDPRIKDQLQQLKDAAEQLKQNNALMQSQKDRIDAIVQSTESWKQKQKELTDLFNSSDPKLKITQQQYSDAMRKVASDAKTAHNDSKQFFSTITKGLKDAVFGGKQLTDVFKSMGKELAELAAKQWLLKPLEDWIGSGGKGGIGGISGPIGKIGRMLGFASGGRHPSNEPFLVGELGPEIIIPDGAGTVIPNKDIHKYDYGKGLKGYALGGTYGGAAISRGFSGGGVSGAIGVAGSGSGKMRPPTSEDFLKIWQVYYRAQYDDYVKRQENGDKAITMFQVESARARMRQWDAYTAVDAKGFQFFANGLPQIMAQYPNAFIGKIDQAVLSWFQSSGVPNLLPGFPTTITAPGGGDGGDPTGGGTIPTDGSYGPINPNGNGTLWGVGGAYGSGTSWQGVSPIGAGGGQSYIGAPKEANGHQWNGVSDYNGAPARPGYEQVADAIAKATGRAVSDGAGKGIGTALDGITSRPFQNGNGLPWWDSDGTLSQQTPGNIPGVDYVPSNKDNNPDSAGSTAAAYDFYKKVLDHATGDQIALIDFAFDTYKRLSGSDIPLPNWLLTKAITASGGFMPALSSAIGDAGYFSDRFISSLFPTLRGYASGGRPAPGQVAMVGEKGPELWVPDQSGTIFPNGSFGFGGSSMSQKISINNASPNHEATVTSHGHDMQVEFKERQRDGFRDPAVAAAAKQTFKGLTQHFTTRG